MTRYCPVAAGTLVWLLALIQPLAAQVTVELGTMAVYYRPLGDFEKAFVYSTSLPRNPADLSAGALGGEARVWIGHRLGFQLQGATFSSQVEGGFTPGGLVGPTPVRVVSLSGQALYAFLPHGRGQSAWLSGGLCVVQHGGRAYKRYESTTDLGAVLGVGGAVTLHGPLSASGGLGMLLYPFDIPLPEEERLNPGRMQHGFQQDLLMHVGVSWRISFDGGSG